MVASRVAVITGAGSGIGKAVAQRLAAQQCALVLLDVDGASIGKLKAELNSKADISTIVADVSDPAAVENAVKTALSSFKRVDYLVNSAGIDHLALVVDCELEAWRRIMAVNLDGTFNMCRFFAPTMIKQRAGRIVNVASWLAKSGMAGHAPYAASKFGILGLTQSMAKEVAQYGITVNAVCPGPIDHTIMRAEADAQSAAKGLPPASERVKLIPMGRMGEPDDVAGVIAFLLSADADYMTGQAINVTGGLWMN